jgi:5-(hydroxymethyl)furfural/furfural oxidase
MASKFLSSFDFIIVGGGTAGCVLANRLSSRSGNKILLCEAGQDTPPGSVPLDILDSYPGRAFLNPTYQWRNLGIDPVPILSGQGPQITAWKRYEQAKVLGGGSSINGQLANRGLPSDYDEWEALGAEGWNWKSVLPYFIRCEKDLDYDGALHGKDGPIPITRLARSKWSGHGVAFAKAFEAQGFKFIGDQNAAFNDGFFTLPASNSGEHRVSTAIGYLDSAVRSRPNLTILCDANVTELLFEGNRCIGAKVVVEGQARVFGASEVILSSGAIHSPAHLLRSGIGPARELAEGGVGVRHDLPGVGKRMMDHPLAVIAALITPDARLRPGVRRHQQLGLRFSSGAQGCAAGDMAAFVSSKSAWHAIGSQIGSTMVAVYKSYSEAGEVRLKSPDPMTEPSVELNLLADERDARRLMNAFRYVGEMYSLPPVRRVIRNAFPMVWSERARALGAITPKNRALTLAGSMLLDGPKWLRDLLVKRLITGGATLADVLESDKTLENYIRRSVASCWHVCASCRMGTADDNMAVTDSAGRVRGIAGLRVVDASVFPSVPSANLNLPIIMLAEKMSDLILNK